MTESEESFLVPPNVPEPDKVWCQIDEKGEFKFVDWHIVQFLASQFDSTPPEARSESMLIGKLMWLVREDTKKLYEQTK